MSSVCILIVACDVFSSPFPLHFFFICFVVLIHCIVLYFTSHDVTHVTLRDVTFLYFNFLFFLTFLFSFLLDLTLLFPHDAFSLLCIALMYCF